MLFILNKSMEVVESLNDRGNMSSITPYFDDEYVQDLSTGAETFTFSTLGDSVQSQHLVVGNFIAFRHKSDFKLFNIINIEEEHTDLFLKHVYCEMASIELINEIIRPMKFSGTVRSFVNTILEETSWQLGLLDMSFTETMDLNITDHKSVYSLLQEHIVGSFGGELAYRVEIKNNEIAGKYVDIYRERGRDRGLVFSYSKNISSVKRTLDTSEIATALIGIGNNNISFKDLDLEDKPAGQDFVMDEDAYRRWNVNGKHILGVHKADTDSPQELVRLTRLALEERKEPKAKYEIKVELLDDEVEIGDTVRIVDHEFNPPLYLQGRVNQLKTSKTDSTKDECVLSNFKEIGTNISAELKALAGYVDSQFPIGSDKIQDGAINGDKLQDGQIIKGTHLFANSITADKIKAGEIQTEHLQANSITADKITTGELITLSAQIKDAVIDSAHIKQGSIDSVHINEGSINSAHIQDATIGTAQIKDAEITVAKIQDAFIDNLVAKQGKFESAHIGKLTSDNIDANTIKAEHITASVIDAINMSVSGTIDASKINVKDLVVDNIDAGSIVSGTIDADRINGSVITAINASIENAVIDQAKIGELSADKITSGEISTDILKANIISAINASIGKIDAEHIDVGSIKVDEIDAGAIVSGTIDANRITGSVVQAINLSADKVSANNIDVEGLKVGGANIVEGSIVSAHIQTGQISNAHIDKAFVADAYIKKLDASKITTGTLDTARVNVSSTSGNLSIVNNTMQIKDRNEKVRVQLGEDSTGDYGLIIQDAEGNTMWDFTGATANGIQNNAITTDKIKDESITASKLVMEEIWADEGFISNFQSQSIDAGQIKTGKITGDYIDITGLVSFDALDPEIAENFRVTRDEDGNVTKTWINGNQIATGSVTADKINTRGLTAVNTVGETTFNIDATTGDVTMSGLVQSNNYSDVKGKESGYRLTPNGDAHLNQAIVRGSVILPTSGITNEGGDNLLPYTDFTIDVRNKYTFWGSNFSSTIDTNQGILTIKNSTLDAVEDGGLVTPVIIGGLKANTKYTLSFKARSSSNTATLDYNYIISNESGVSNQKIGNVTINAYNSWDNTQSITFTPTRDYPQAKILIGFKDIVITGNTNQKGFAIKELRLVEGEKTSMWFENSPVRFYAGADYENRNKAPFRVLQDGSIIATKGNFGGTITGSLNIGNIMIEDTTTTNGSITIKNNDNSKEVIKINEDLTHIDTNFILGNTQEKLVEFNKSGKKLTSNIPVAINDKKGVKVELVNTTERLSVLHSSCNDGDHWQKYYNGSYIFDSRGSQAGADFQFEKNGNETPVKVSVMGEMYARDKITMNNNIAIVSRQDKGNSGFDYVVK